MLADHCGALASGGLEFPEVIAAFALAVRFVAALFPSVAAVPLQAACLSLRAVDFLSLGAGFLLFNQSRGSAR